MAMDHEIARQRIEANNARIAELRQELQTIQGNAGAYTDRDYLDMELASNRARAMDITGAESALNRIDSRVESARKAVQDAKTKRALDKYENDLKVAEIDKEIRKLQLDYTQAPDDYKKAVIKNQMDYLEEKRKQLGAKPGEFAFNWQGFEDMQAFKNDLDRMAPYGADGKRHWNVEVSDEDKKVMMARSQKLGNDELYKEVSTMSTSAARKRAGVAADNAANEAADLARDVVSEIGRDKAKWAAFLIEMNTGTSPRVKKLKKAGYKFDMADGLHK